MIRVVILGTRGFPNVQGGVEKHCQQLSIRLVKLGCEVIVFTRRPYVDNSIKEYKGVRLIGLAAIRLKSLEAFLHTLLGIFYSLWFKPDLLHIQGIGPALLAPLARILGFRVVVTSHGANYRHLKWGVWARLILRLGEYLSLLSANQMIAVSEVIAKELKIRRNRQINVIANGVNIPRRLNSEKMLKKYSLTRNKYFLSVGRLVPVKGFDKLIDAFNQAKMNDWKLVIAGSADQRSAYSQKLFKKSAQNPNVILTGFVNGKGLQELFSQAGLFVLPSYYEGLPLALLEAISYGLPCLATNIPANRGLGLADENYFRPGNIREICGKLQQFRNKRLSSKDKMCQKKILRKKHNWNRIARETYQVYKKALDC